MARYKWDPQSKQMVKIADRIFHCPGAAMERPFAQQIADGYKRQEAKGNRVYGKPAGINRIWS